MKNIFKEDNSHLVLLLGHHFCRGPEQYEPLVIGNLIMSNPYDEYIYCVVNRSKLAECNQPIAWAGVYSLPTELINFWCPSAARDLDKIRAAEWEDLCEE